MARPWSWVLPTLFFFHKDSMQLMFRQLKWFRGTYCVVFLPTKPLRINCDLAVTVQWITIISRQSHHGSAASSSFSVAVSPVGGAVLNMTPALPLREDPHWGSRTSEGIKLDPLPLLSSSFPLDLQRCGLHRALGWAPIWVHKQQPVVPLLVVVPVGLVRCLILNAELHCTGEFAVLRHRNGEGEGVCVGTTIDVVQVLTGNVLEGVPRVEGDPDPHQLLEGQVLDLDCSWEQTVLDGTGL